MSIPPQGTAGAIFKVGYSTPLFEDIRARHVGDMITILLVEQTNASTQASTSTSKDNTMDLSNPTLLGSAFSLNAPRSLINRTGNYTLDNQLDSSSEFSGEGDSSQSNSMSGSVTVTVNEVLSNGYLVVRGEKRISINQGDEYLRFSGIVRPRDITPDNTVLSTQVANASITYTGKGAVADANRMGWLSSFLGRWWPF